MHLPPYIITVNRIIFGAWINGITIFPFIFVTKERRSRDKQNKIIKKPWQPDEYKTLIAHEKIHIRQQLKGLFIVFAVRYFYFQWKYGYKKNPYEVEAYAHQNDWKV